jgi:hypothetical protein
MDCYRKTQDEFLLIDSVLGRAEVYKGFHGGNLREGGHLEDPVVDGRIMLMWIFRKWDMGVWTGSIRLRIGTSGG